MGVKEIGFQPIALTQAGVDSPLEYLADVPVLHWHGDQFDIPDGGIRLAESAVCPNQAFSYGEKVLALQFHLEADTAYIEQWLVGHACELAQAGVALDALREDAARYGAPLRQAGLSVLEVWLSGDGQ